MAYELFNQKRQVIIGGKIFDYEELDIYFEIDFSNKPDSNVGTIKVYNLKQDTIRKIKKGSEVEVIGGYGDNFGTLFKGVIDKYNTEVDSADKLTTIHISNNGFSWKKKKINRSWPPGTISSTIAKELIEASDFKLGKLDLVNDVEYKKGKTFICEIKKALEEIAKDTKTKLFNTSTFIYLLPYKSNINRLVLLDSDSGLISIEKKDDNRYSIECFLRYEIEEDCKVKIKGSKYDGIYLVEKGKHIGGEASNFVTKLEVIRCE